MTWTTLKSPAFWQAIAAAVAALLMVLATGGPHSPFGFLLWFPVLWAVARVGLGTGFGLSLAPAGFVLAEAAAHRDAGPLPVAAWAGALSLPALALFSGWLRDEAERRRQALELHNSELSTLLDMSQMMDAAYDLDMTLNLLLLNAQKLSGCQVCAIYLIDSSGENLELRAASGRRERLDLLPGLPLAEARAGVWSADSLPQLGQTVLAFYAPDTALPAAVGDGSRLFDLDHRARAFACLPLTSIEGLLGLLYISFDQPRALPPLKLARVEQLATRAAFSLQRVLLQQGFQSLAYSDAMTGLDNFRQFERGLADELRRAERYGHPLSVILLDIDHFKRFNDTLGHQAGDALLGQLAVVLRNSLRAVDKPARYGGEEFVIICPETGREEARLIAERVRRNVAETAFALLDKGHRGDGEGGAAETAHVTVSVGFATFPQDARAARDLVRKADAALYTAKAAGRNTVRGADDAASPLLLL